MFISSVHFERSSTLVEVRCRRWPVFLFFFLLVEAVGDGTLFFFLQLIEVRRWPTFFFFFFAQNEMPLELPLETTANDRLKQPLEMTARNDRSK